MPEIVKLGMFAEKCLDFRPRSVVAAVIDGEHLAKRTFRHFGEGFLDQGTDIALLIERRDDNRNTYDD
jgi:hypothetical protein